MTFSAARSLSLCESTHPCQGSGLAASLTPRSWHVQHGSTPTEPQAPRMLDEPLGSPLPSTSLLHLSILRTGSKEILNEPDPLSLRTDESVASSFALLHLLKPLFMGLERLTQLV